MIDFDSAQQRFAHGFASPVSSERVPLAQAAGRVLAAPVQALLDQPPADHSAMDGYAVRHAEVVPGAPLRVQQRCYAGDTPHALAPGCATRLFTGSLIPPGADTVLVQEQAHEADGRVAFEAAGQPGRHIRRRGEDVRAGEALIPAGVRLQAAHIGLLAAQGIDTVDVFPMLRVGILTTGDELVPLGQPRTPQQIHNSNAPMLAALVQGMGATAARTLHAGDSDAAIAHALRELHAHCDLILTTGGASVGEKDRVRPALSALGAAFVLTGVRMKPGKPVALAQWGRTPVVVLPGNPGAVLASFALLVSPLIRCLQGRADRLPVTPALPIDFETGLDATYHRFLRVRCDAPTHGLPVLVALAQQGAGALHGLAQTSGLACLPVGRPVARGDTVPYCDFGHWLV